MVTADRLLIGNANTKEKSASDLKSGDVLVGDTGESCKIVDITDLGEVLIIYTDRYRAFFVGVDGIARVQRAV